MDRRQKVPRSPEVVDLTIDREQLRYRRSEVNSDIDEQKPCGMPPPFLIEDDEEEDEDDCVRELNKDEIHDLQSKLSCMSIKAATTPPGYRSSDFAITPYGARISVGECVELLDGDFLKVKLIYKELNGQGINLRGILIRRARYMEGYLQKWQNEVCAILQDVESANNPDLDSSLVSYPVEDVLQVREIIFTNQQFPRWSFRTSGKMYRNIAEVDETAPLVCRWKYVEYRRLKSGKVVSGALMHLRSHEADPGKGTSDVEKKLSYRATSVEAQPWMVSSRKQSAPTNATLRKSPVKNGSNLETAVDLTSDSVMFVNGSETEFDLEERSSRVRRASNTHDRLPTTTGTNSTAYTFGDICAGGGGFTRGADQAGVQVKFVLDHWSSACNTLALNWAHKGAGVLLTDVFNFCTNEAYAKGYIVDMLHISFPCQTYSAVHTVEGKNDTHNEATGYAVCCLLRRCRPRVVTFEQTSGLLLRHPVAFRALVNQITSSGYTVRWEIANCAELENVQPRPRLFMIASCPGEPLPPFPERTHGTTPDLLPLVTIKDCMAKVPRSVPQHMQAFTPKDQPSYDPNVPLRGAITCDGGASDLHPSGRRTFNMKELSILAGFPPEHEFAPDNKTNLRKLIGNAVPSVVAHKIVGEIVKSMRADDRLVAAHKPEVISLE